MVDSARGASIAATIRWAAALPFRTAFIKYLDMCFTFSKRKRKQATHEAAANNCVLTIGETRAWRLDLFSVC